MNFDNRYWRFKNEKFILFVQSQMGRVQNARDVETRDEDHKVDSRGYSPHLFDASV